MKMKVKLEEDGGRRRRGLRVGGLAASGLAQGDSEKTENGLQVETTTPRIMMDFIPYVSSLILIFVHPFYEHKSDLFFGVHPRLLCSVAHTSRAVLPRGSQSLRNPGLQAQPQR